MRVSEGYNNNMGVYPLHTGVIGSSVPGQTPLNDIHVR